jgi:hypothetical protein
MRGKFTRAKQALPIFFTRFFALRSNHYIFPFGDFEKWEARKKVSF